MKRIFVLMLVLTMVIGLGSIAMADEIPGGSVSFDVKWTVYPMIYFGVFSGEDLAVFENGELLFGNDEFADYIFEERTPELFTWGEFFYEENIYGNGILAAVASNDNWKVQFNKPALVSDNDHFTAVPVYAERYLYDFYNDTESEKAEFTGNDTIKKDVGAYYMYWDLHVKYQNWMTRAGNYTAEYEIICTQL